MIKVNELAKKFRGYRERKKDDGGGERGETDVLQVRN